MTPSKYKMQLPGPVLIAPPFFVGFVFKGTGSVAVTVVTIPASVVPSMVVSWIVAVVIAIENDVAATMELETVDGKRIVSEEVEMMVDGRTFTAGMVVPGSVVV